MTAIYNLSVRVYGHAPAELADTNFNSKALAVAEFHKAAAIYIQDRDVYVGLGIQTSAMPDGSRSFTVLASKSRGDAHVVLEQAFYRRHFYSR